MYSYISLLRGINVSGQKKIKMIELKALYQSLDFEQVTTYIQSGNVVFKSSITSKEKLEEIIKGAIQKQFGYDVVVLVVSKAELLNTYQQNPFLTQVEDTKSLYVTFLSTSPHSDKKQELEQLDFTPDQFIIKGVNIYVCCPNGYGRTKITNNFFEKKLKIEATTRNWRSIGKLLDIVNALN